MNIGSLSLKHNILLAPLAGITNLPFRLLCRRYGAALAFTEMVSVNGLVRSGANTLALLRRTPDDTPLGIQLFGDSPGDLAEAARMVGESGELVDINMGCPVRKVVGTGAGSALLKDTARIAAIIAAVRKATPLPLTVKIRSGWHCGDETYLEVGRIAEAEGCDAITLHPRSRSRMFGGTADWSQIAALKQRLGIPVIGSGDLFRPEDCMRMLADTGCDGVMIARGALGAPWIFRQTLELLSTGSMEPVTNAERAATLRSHLEMFAAEQDEAVAVREIKKHVGWYAKGFPGAADIRRDANAAHSMAEILGLAERIAAMPEPSRPADA